MGFSNGGSYCITYTMRLMGELLACFPDLEKEMATHSSILAWIIQRCSLSGSSIYGVTSVGHNLATKPPRL